MNISAHKIEDLKGGTSPFLALRKYKKLKEETENGA